MNRSNALVSRLRALRAFSFPVSALPVVVATAAVRPIGHWQWDILIAAMLGVVALHAAGNLWNDYFDYRSGVDRKVDDDENRPGRLLVRGELMPRDVFGEAVFFLVLGLGLGAYLLWRCGPGLLWFGGGAVAALYAYTGPPLKLKYRAMGEGLIFLTFGPLLMLGAAYAQVGRLDWTVAVLSIPIGLATTAVVVGNNLRDIDEDRSADIQTLTHAVGAGFVRGLYIGLVAACTVGLAVLALAGVAPAAAIGTPVLLVLLAKPLQCVWRRERLADIDARTAKFTSAVLVLVLLGLVIEGRPC